MKAGQTQSEVLKIHAETTPLLTADGCYSFFPQVISEGGSSFWPSFILVYLFYSEPPNLPLPSLPPLLVSVYFYYLILFLVSSELGSVTALHGSQKGTR